MHRPPILSLLVIALIALPGASAGWFDRDEPITIEVAASRVGQRTLMSYAIDYREETGDPSFTPTIQRAGETTAVIEGAARTTDGFGIERDTIARLVQETRGEGETVQLRRHCLLGSDEHVRTDYLGGASFADESAGASTLAGLPLYSFEAEFAFTPIASYDPGPCETAPNATRHVEGETLTLGALTGAAEADRGADVGSAPAVATTFYGRAALRYVFDVADIERAIGVQRHSTGSLAYVLADGLPGIVEMTRAQTWARGHYYTNATLIGYEAGIGDAVLRGGASLPERHPDAAFSDERTRFDDTALKLSFPFARAMQFARLDPQGVGPWLDAHPDAVLSAAWFLGGTAGEAGARRDEWYLSWSDETDAITVRVEETNRVETMLGAVDLPMPIPSPVQAFGSDSAGRPVVWPEGGVLAGDAIGAAALREGIEPGSIRMAVYMMLDGEGFLLLDQAGLSDEGGRLLDLDIVRGAVRSISDQESHRTESGILALRPGSDGLRGSPAEGTALSALAGPVDGLALPAAAATGLALLVIAAKFLLVPLFTRLRRASLLDNPTRSRVFERVREHPGVHLAALAQLVGLSESATRHHVEQLAKHRYVIEIDVDGARRYYAAGELSPDDARRAGLLRSEPTRAVYELYVAEPNASLRDAARRLGSSAPGVHRIKKKLVREGLLPPAQR